MSKKIIAVAVAAALAPVAAMADGNVTIYGRADGGYVVRGGSDGLVHTRGRFVEFASGVQSGSRIGFRGTEDIGNGLKAIFEIEEGVNIDDGTFATRTGPGGRHSWVGLTGDFGTALFGRVDGGRYGLSTKYDPFGAGTVGQSSSLMTHASRGDNAAVYVTPTFGGFKVITAYTTQLITQESRAGAQTITAGAARPTAGANQGDGRLALVIPVYENGPLSISGDYEQFKPKGVDNSRIHLYVVGASFDFGPVKLHGYAERIAGDSGSAGPLTGNGYVKPDTTADNWNQRAYMLGVSAPFGPFSVRGSVAYLDDRTEKDSAGRQVTGDCTKFNLGLSYNLSKRTSVYTDATKINNKGNGTCTVAFAANSGSLDDRGGTGPASGFGTYGFDLGLAHNF